MRFCINDLLDATRLETGKLALELKATVLDALVSRVVTAMLPLAAEKKIVLKHEVQPDLPAVLLDEHRITQVITNLLDNAFKYTPAGGQITVQAGALPGNPEWLQVSVSDTGPRTVPVRSTVPLNETLGEFHEARIYGCRCGRGPAAVRLGHALPGKPDVQL